MAGCVSVMVWKIYGFVVVVDKISRMLEVKYVYSDHTHRKRRSCVSFDLVSYENVRAYLGFAFRIQKLVVWDLKSLRNMFSDKCLLITKE